MFLLSYLNSWAARADVAFKSVGAIQAHYNTTTLANLSVPVPPLLEQAEILGRLETDLTPSQTATDHAEREIALLREYRTRLIADVVTGKLDVRAAAARLPEEAEEVEGLDDVDGLGEGEEVQDEMAPTEEAADE